MSTYNDFLDRLDENQHRVANYLDQILADLNLDRRMRYDLPFYYQRSWICYLNHLNNGKIELAFTRGTELSNESGALQSKGRKQVYSIEFGKVSEIDDSILSEIVHEAIILDETVPYASKRKS